jgi:hypothetical protein
MRTWFMKQNGNFEKSQEFNGLKEKLNKNGWFHHRHLTI